MHFFHEDVTGHDFSRAKNPINTGLQPLRPLHPEAIFHEEMSP